MSRIQKPKGSAGFVMNVTKTLVDKKSGDILSVKKSRNEIKDVFFERVMEAVATGDFFEHFAVGYVHMWFITTDDVEHAGRRPSDDSMGMDLIDGGDRTKPSAKWRSYFEPEATITVKENQIAAIQYDGLLTYAEDVDDTEVTSDQRYILDWEITAFYVSGET